MLELLLVLAILGLASAFAIAGLRDSGARAFEREAARLHAELVGLRSKARTSGTAVALRAREDLVLEDHEGRALEQLLFFPDGRATPARLVFRREERQVLFDIHASSRIDAGEAP